MVSYFLLPAWNLVTGFGVLWDRLGRIGDGRSDHPDSVGSGNVCDVCCEFNGSKLVPDSPGMTRMRRRWNRWFRLITLPAEVLMR